MIRVRSCEPRNTFFGFWVKGVLAMADDVVWDSLVKRSDATLKSTQRISAFFRQFAQAENEYGKKLMSSTIMMSKDGGQSLIPQDDIVHQWDAGAAVPFFSWESTYAGHAQGR